MTTPPTHVLVDDDGVHLSTEDDVVVDVLFDGRRVWSFWTHRDTEPHDTTRLAPWPKPLRQFLDGSATITVREHNSEGDLFHDEVEFGEGDGEIVIENGRGKPLGIDKSGRLVMTFETRTAAQVAPLLDSVHVVLDALRNAGIEGFLAYGSLLGAVRDQALIGHDSDADLGYVSRYSHPVDVIRESYRIQRALIGQGLEVVRYSGGGIKVIVEETDGARRGLDVFSGFLDEGHLILMGEIRAPFRPEWIWPLTTATLEGQEFPVPAQPEHLLAATYGPGWRVPDPAFKFETPQSTSERLNDWFRGMAVHRPDWDRRYAAVRRSAPPSDPHPVARAVLADSHTPDLVVDLGCGRGQDSWWLAGEGVRSIGLDFAPSGFTYLREHPDGRPVEFAPMNLLDDRHVLGWGTRIGATPGRRVVLARHVVDALSPRGRTNLWRFLRAACQDGGRAYLDFLVSPVEGDRWARRHGLSPIDPDLVTSRLVEHGASVVASQELRTKQMGVAIARDRRRAQRRGHRVVVEWPR